MLDDTKKSMGIMFLILAVIILVTMFVINTKQLSRLIVNERFGSGGYTLLYYTKTGCPYCDAFEPEWTQLQTCVNNFTAGDGRNCDLALKLEKRSIESNMDDLKTYGITGVPHLVLTLAGNHTSYADTLTMPRVIAWLNSLPAPYTLPCSITCSVS